MSKDADGAKDDVCGHIVKVVHGFQCSARHFGDDCTFVSKLGVKQGSLGGAPPPAQDEPTSQICASRVSPSTTPQTAAARAPPKAPARLTESNSRSLPSAATCGVQPSVVQVGFQCIQGSDLAHGSLSNIVPTPAIFSVRSIRTHGEEGPQLSPWCRARLVLRRTCSCIEAHGLSELFAAECRARRECSSTQEGRLGLRDVA